MLLLNPWTSDLITNSGKISHIICLLFINNEPVLKQENGSRYWYIGLNCTEWVIEKPTYSYLWQLRKSALTFDQREYMYMYIRSAFDLLSIYLYTYIKNIKLKIIFLDMRTAFDSQMREQSKLHTTVHTTQLILVSLVVHTYVQSALPLHWIWICWMLMACNSRKI